MHTLFVSLPENLSRTFLRPPAPFSGLGFVKFTEGKLAAPAPGWRVGCKSRCDSIIEGCPPVPGVYRAARNAWKQTAVAGNRKVGGEKKKALQEGIGEPCSLRKSRIDRAMGSPLVAREPAPLVASVSHAAQRFEISLFAFACPASAACLSHFRLFWRFVCVPSPYK